ncbi:MAG: right-handed parallel beta-helix repeat-containing protein [Planctomycetota bacterium]|nr:right-handed parallel beta-helix repeat-containing protein [Planctomycetota bacterium]
MKTLNLLTAALSTGLLLTATASADVLFVSAELTSGANNGDSWADAFQGSEGLQAAIAVAAPGDQIYVAEGLYKPTEGIDRTVSFQWKAGVKIYGGFLGHESNPYERPGKWAARTILSGDLQGNDANSEFEDNSFHVVEAIGTDSESLLDGLVIEAGNAIDFPGANGRGGGLVSDQVDALRLKDCVFQRNRASTGGGAYLSATSVEVIDCEFLGNHSVRGGGVYLDSATSALLTRNRFMGNLAISDGGAGLYIYQGDEVVVSQSVIVHNFSLLGSSEVGIGIFLEGVGSAKVLNCTISWNDHTSVSTSSLGYGIFNTGGSTEVTNCIVSENGPEGVQNPAGQIAGAQWTHSLVDGGPTTNGNLNAVAQFVNPGIDFALTATSPGVDAGNNAAVASTPYSVDHGRRFVDSVHAVDTGLGMGPIVDMGAFEYSPMDAHYDCLSTANSTGQPGLIHFSGSRDLSVNQLTLRASGLPLNEFGYFLTSQTRGFAALPGGSQGNLCLGGALGRFNQAGQIRTSGALAEFSLPLNPGTLPHPQGSVSVHAGETWHFQGWFRDGNAGVGASNFTDRVSIRFE